MTKEHQGAKQPTPTPYTGKNLPPTSTDTNQTLNRLRAPGERAFAQLTTWNILHHYDGCPTKVGDIITAVLLLNKHQ